MRFEEIKQQEAANIMPTYGRFPVALVSGKGAVAKDCDGKEYVDFTSGIGVNSLGYCDEGWVKAVSQQAATLQHISNLYYSPVQTALAEKLCQLTGFSKVFFGNSGAEANECAIKLARKYSHDTYGAERGEIVTLRNSFHGRTVTTLAATGQDGLHTNFAPFTEGFRYAEAPTMEAVSACVTENTCAVMIEFIQGEGGVIPLSQAVVESLHAYCTERRALCISEIRRDTGYSHFCKRPWRRIAYRRLPLRRKVGCGDDRRYARFNIRREPGGLRRRTGSAREGFQSGVSPAG